MARQRLDSINYAGNTYEFVDQTARDGNVALNEKIGRLNDEQKRSLDEEVERAYKEELLLDQAKVDKEDGKGLSTNDFTDEYKEMVEHPAEMTGALYNADGSAGLVPAPKTSDWHKYLRGDGSWHTPTDTKYTAVTDDADGLMTKEEHIKLANIDTSQDDMSADKIVFNADGSISETLGNGKTKKTVFNSDGSITQTIVNSAGTKTTLKTTFNTDGSITRTVT